MCHVCVNLQKAAPAVGAARCPQCGAQVGATPAFYAARSAAEPIPPEDGVRIVRALSARRRLGARGAVRSGGGRTYV